MDSTTKTIIKLVSYNCKYVKTSRSEIQRLCDAADIVCLQETWLWPHDISFLGEIHEDFAYAGTSAVDVSNLVQGRPYGGVAVLWRKSLFQDVSVLQSASDRIAAIKVITGNSAFVVCSVYMPTDCADNLALFTQCLGALSAIVEESDVECAYMLGDYNAHPTSTFGKALLSFSLEQDWLCADQNFLCTTSDNFTFISEAHHCRKWLDHCIVTNSAWETITNACIDYNVYKSDHFPLVIECNLSVIKSKFQYKQRHCNKVIWGARDSHQIKEYSNYCNSRLRDIIFPDELRQCSLQNCICDSSDHKNIIDSMYNQIISILSEAAIITYRSKKCTHKKKVVGWNQHVSAAHTEARICFKHWLEYGKPLSGHIYELMLESRRIFKAKLKWCVKNQNQIKMDIIAKHHQKKDFSKFWKSVSNLNSKPSLPVSVGGASDHKHIANIFMQYFRAQALPKNSETDSTSGVGVCDAVPSCEEALLQFPARDINNIIKNMRRGKSPGHDGLSIEHLQHAGVHLPNVLSLFYNLCIKHSYMPPDLMRTIVVPIVKNKTGDSSDKTNYRPISLATVTAKVLDSLLDKQLGKHLKLHDAQFGFRAGLSTESAIFALKETVTYYTKRGTPVFGCFLDLSKAFDLVSYQLLWDKLSATGTPHEVVSLFRHWYAHQDNCVRWADEVSDTYRLECGVRQGGISSPKLFCLYVNELIGELSSMHAGCSIDGQRINNISYADDMVLLCPSVCALRRLLLVCEDYAERHGLKYNNNKSEVMVFAARGRPPSDIPPVCLGGRELARITLGRAIKNGEPLTSPTRVEKNNNILPDEVMEASSSDYSDEEVGVLARGQKLWVRGVRSHTTCADIVRALQGAPEAGSLSEQGEWVLAERWRGVERPLPPDAPVLHVLAAWGDARHEVRLSLRRLSSGGEEDSGRDSDGGSRSGRRRRRQRTRPVTPPPPGEDPAAKLVTVIQHQSRTIHQQLDKLREQEKLIDELEDQTHKNRMEKHGTNYLLESYLRDLGRSSEVNDSQAGNSDSGVGVGSGTPPRRHTKHKSRRERHLMREHYFTKELTDICQVNSDRLKQTHNDTDSESSADELTRIREEIELLEKMAIINKRLHREEELVVRLTAKVKRYVDENKVNSCENATQVAMFLDKIEEELATSTKEMQNNAVELARTDGEIEHRMKLIDELTLELEEEEYQNGILERQLNATSSRQPILLQETYVPVLEQSSSLHSPGYVLDTLV